MKNILAYQQLGGGGGNKIGRLNFIKERVENGGKTTISS